MKLKSVKSYRRVKSLDIEMHCHEPSLDKEKENYHNLKVKIEVQREGIDTSPHTCPIIKDKERHACNKYSLRTTNVQAPK